MRNAFSLAELLIVAAVLGILAALALPLLHNHAVETKETAARENLRLLRDAIELYAIRHKGVAPGYPNNDRATVPTAQQFQEQTTVHDNCLLKIPENPFNNLNRVRIIGNDEDFPVEATGRDGWIYQPVTKSIRVDWPGIDRHGIRYFDY